MNRKIGILGWFALAGLAAAAGSLELNDYLGEEWTDPRSRAGIWELHFTRPDDVSVRPEVQPGHAAKVDVAETNGVKTCVWRDFWKHGDKLESVTVTATPGQYPREWRFRLSAKIRPGWVMTDAHFPRVTLREKIVGYDDRAMCGKGVAGVVHDPVHSKCSFWGIQPGMVVAPFFCRYTDERLFYAACEDPGGEVKGLMSYTNEFGMCFMFFHKQWAKGDFKLPYPVVVSCLEPKDGQPCDWYDAADRYREWAERQSWCRTPFLERSDVPRFYKDAPVKLTRFDRQSFGNEYLTHPARMKRFIDRRLAEGLQGAPLFISFVGWEKHHPWVGPDYFPCHPSEEAIADIVSYAKDRGIRAYFWPSSFNYAIKFRKPAYVDRRAERPFLFDHLQEFLGEGLDRVASLDRKGSWTNEVSWMFGGYLASLCPGAPAAQDWLERTTVRPLMRRGASLLHLDQFNMNCMKECWATNHGHCPFYGKWKTEAARETLRRVQRVMREYDPEGIVAHEGPNEKTIDLLTLVDTRPCQFLFGEWANPMSYLYHGYILPFHCELFPNRFQVAFSAVDGLVPQFQGKLNERGDNEDAGLGKMMLDWALLYRGKGRPYLAYGRRIRPPQLTCAKARYNYSWWGHKPDFMYPAVFHEAYQAADGSQAVCLANATEAEQACSMTWKGKAYDLRLAPGEIRLVVEGKQGEGRQ